MSSTPSSTLSSPGHGLPGRRPGSRMSITEGISPLSVRPGSPTFSGGGGGPAFHSKLSRRWSLDNLSPNSAREGYVRDLRRQHKASQQPSAMDEGYPFMLTEARQVSNTTRASICGSGGFGIIPSTSMGSGGMNSGVSSGNASAVCSRPGSASPPPYQPVQHPKSIVGCKRPRSYSLDEDVHVGGRFGGRYLPIGGPNSSIGGSSVSHGHQRLFVKNSFSSATDISTSTPVVPEDNELPATLVTPQTRLSLGTESIGVLSGGVLSGSDSAPAINRVSPETPLRLTVASASQGGTNIHSGSSGASSRSQQCKSEAYFRKRSSSLPRILPPIFDDDDDDSVDCEYSEDGNITGGSGSNSVRKSSWKQKNLPSHQDHTSNLIVREMQKFVCRHAIDVSQVLPLPLPTSSRQSRLLQDHGRSNSIAAGGNPFAGVRSSSAIPSSFNSFKSKYNSASLLPSSNTASPILNSRHARLLMATIAKVHAVSFAIKCKSPRLFEEIVASLDLTYKTTSASMTPSSCNLSPSSPSPSPTSKTFPQRPFSSNASRQLSKSDSTEKKHQALLDDAFKNSTGSTETDPLKASLRRKVEQQIGDLYSATCTVPFCVLVHGHLSINTIVFRYGHTSQSQPTSDDFKSIPTAVSLPSLIHASIGSPLLDIYQVLYYCNVNPDNSQSGNEDNLEKESLLFSYHASFIEVCNQLRVKVTDFSRERLESDVEKYELAGMILAAASLGNNFNSQSFMEADRSRNSSQHHSIIISSDGTPLTASNDEVEMTNLNEGDDVDQVPVIIKRLIEAKINDNADPT